MLLNIEIVIVQNSAVVINAYQHNVYTSSSVTFAAVLRAIASIKEPVRPQ